VLMVQRMLIHFLMDKRFGIFATNIYFSSLQLTKSQIASNMEMDPDDVVFVWMNDVDEEHCPKFLVLVDHLTLSVVLVIRGTFSFKDVLMDIVCEDAEFLDGFAHSGFLAGSRMVLNKCGSLLEKTLNDHFGYNLVICGHSMGGSVAMMITMELLRNDSSMVLPPGVSVRCVALGPAPVYRTEGEIPRIFREHIHIYTNDRDVVPRQSGEGIFHSLSQWKGCPFYVIRMAYFVLTLCVIKSTPKSTGSNKDLQKERNFVSHLVTFFSESLKSSSPFTNLWVQVLTFLVHSWPCDLRSSLSVADD